MGHHELPMVKGCSGLARSDKGINFLPVFQASIRKVSCLWACSKLTQYFLRNQAQSWSECFWWKQSLILNCRCIKTVHLKPFSVDKFSPKARKAIHGNPGWILGQYVVVTKLVFSDSAVMEHSCLLRLQVGQPEMQSPNCNRDLVLHCSWAPGTFRNPIWSHSCLVIETPWRRSGLWSPEVPSPKTVVTPGPRGP